MAIVYMKEAKGRFAYLTFLSAFPSIILMAHNFSKLSVLLRTVNHLMFVLVWLIIGLL